MSVLVGAGFCWLFAMNYCSVIRRCWMIYAMLQCYSQKGAGSFQLIIIVSTFPGSTKIALVFLIYSQPLVNQNQNQILFNNNFYSPYFTGICLLHTNLWRQSPELKIDEHSCRYHRWVFFYSEEKFKNYFLVVITQ